MEAQESKKRHPKLSTHLHQTKDVISLMWRLYDEIKHGDDDHQTWLKEKIEEFIIVNLLRNGDKR